MGGPATGMVLNLIIMTDESGQHDAVRAASQAGREHPCRVLAVIARDVRAASRLDAEIRSGEGTPGQTVLLRLYGPMSEHADSVITPLLCPIRPSSPGGTGQSRRCRPLSRSACSPSGG